MCSVILHKDDEIAISLYAVIDKFGLGIGITLNWSQIIGTTESLNKPLKILSKMSVLLSQLVKVSKEKQKSRN